MRDKDSGRPFSESLIPPVMIKRGGVVGAMVGAAVGSGGIVSIGRGVFTGGGGAIVSSGGAGGEVGSAGGASVGSGAGASVGSASGGAVGLSVGTGVGSCGGTAVGEIGALVGLELGGEVGATVGCSGACVGALVGVGVIGVWHCANPAAFAAICRPSLANSLTVFGLLATVVVTKNASVVAATVTLPLCAVPYTSQVKFWGTAPAFVTLHARD
jgi:hypothetical protein